MQWHAIVLDTTGYNMHNMPKAEVLEEKERT